jgi:hypothetical protein
MPIKNETSTRFMDEVRIISPWAFAIASLGYVLPAAAMVFALSHSAGAPPMPVPLMLLVGLVGGTVLACAILLIGYINRDAGRRGMSPLLWTLLAIFIPHALGIVLYFVLRKPRILTCPQCREAVEPGFGFCPRCRCRLNAVCPKCQRSVNGGDKFCPSCGGDLGAAGSTASVPVPNQS